jgi:hypothetical protein
LRRRAPPSGAVKTKSSTLEYLPRCSPNRSQRKRGRETVRRAPVLGCSEVKVAVDLGDGLDNVDRSPEQVEPLDLESGQLAPSQPRIGRRVDERGSGA